MLFPRFLADENFNNDILRGLRQWKPELDLLRVQDVGLSGADDPAVLEWAAQETRILITSDYKTLPAFAYERVNDELPMPGIIVLYDWIPVGRAIEVLIQEIARYDDKEQPEAFVYLTE